MFTFFYAADTCSLAVHIALEQAGAPYKAVPIDFTRSEQRAPAYLAVNPKGRVPALVTRQGVLTETPAILTFIGQIFPDAGLLPLDDPFALARAQAFNSYLCSTVHVAHAHRVRGARWADDPVAIAEMQRKAPEVMNSCFDLLERHLLEGPWVLGAVYSACDLYLFVFEQWMDADGVDIQRLPKIRDHRDRMASDPLVRRVLADEAGPGSPQTT